MTCFCSYEDSFEEASAKQISRQPFSQSQGFWLDNNLVKERSSPLTEGGRKGSAYQEDNRASSLNIKET